MSENGRTYTSQSSATPRTRTSRSCPNSPRLRTATSSSGSRKRLADPGQTLFARGIPAHGGTPSVATGKVTAVHQTITASDHSGRATVTLTGLPHRRRIQRVIPRPLSTATVRSIGMTPAASHVHPPRPDSCAAGQAQTQAFAIPISEASLVAANRRAHRPPRAHRAPAFLGRRGLALRCLGSSLWQLRNFAGGRCEPWPWLSCRCGGGAMRALPRVNPITSLAGQPSRPHLDVSSCANYTPVTDQHQLDTSASRTRHRVLSRQGPRNPDAARIARHDTGPSRYYDDTARGPLSFCRSRTIHLRFARRHANLLTRKR